MVKILANDGIDPFGKKLLEDAGFTVDTNTIPQEQLADALKNYDGITVRSATKLRKELIDAAPNIKIIGRGGVGMDNIDVEYARSKGIIVINTPSASSLSVAELVFAHLFTGVRFLQEANRKMPTEGATKFNDLKKAYAKGVELRGKNIGIIGFGRIGKETAAVALGLGMNVLAHDLRTIEGNITLHLTQGITVDIPFKTVSLEEVITQSDFISLHTPLTKKPILGKEEFSKMKKGVGIINCSRGGIVDEQALIEALNNEQVAFAGLDVFDNEPKPLATLLNHPKISLTPHIGASTNEAQERIGEELATLIINHFKN